MSEWIHDASLTLIGPGSVGTALVRECAIAGWTIDSVVLRDRNSFCPAEFRSISIPLQELDVGRIGSWMVITVPDDHISDVVRHLVQVKGVDWSMKSVLHLSGIHSSSLLDPLRSLGARTASCHPLQTFARDQSTTGFNGIHVTMEGDSSFLDELTHFWTRLNATSHRLNRDQKSHIHLAAVFLSNYLVSIAAISEEILQEVLPDGDLSMLAPLLEKTTNNLLTDGPKASLTGPIERGDLTTLKTHLSLMNGHEERKDLYVRLGRVAVELASRKGQEPKTTEALLRLLVG